MRCCILLATTTAMVLTGCLAGADPGDASGPGAASDGPGGGKADGTGALDWDTLWDDVVARCAPAASDEPYLRASDFRWWYSHDEMMARFDEIYASDARLADRAFHETETGTFVLPHVPAWGGRVELSRRLIENVSLHLTRALEQRYADAVFFPDMGHSHLFIPQAHWDANYAGTPVSQISAMYTRMFADPELRVLYHTAEQLQTHDDAGELLDDPALQWRYYHRNPVGDNRGTGELEMPEDLTSRHNTVRTLDGHKSYSAGFNVSANERGCFPFVMAGEIRYFDLSLTDLQ